MRRGVTAIAVKTVFVHEFPPQVCAMAEQTGTALLLYDGVYLEDVIAAVKGVLGQSAAFEKKGQAGGPPLRASSSPRALRSGWPSACLARRRPRCSARRAPFPAGGRRRVALRLRPIGRPPAAGPRSASAACWCCCAPQGGRACRPPLCARRQWAQSEALPLACAGRAMEESVRAARYAQAQGLPAAEYAAMGVQAVRGGAAGLVCAALFAARGWVPCAAMTKKRHGPV